MNWIRSPMPLLLKIVTREAGAPIVQAFDP